jgi:hypothetical protein
VASLEANVEFGVLTGDCLGNLEVVLKEVYGPLLDLELWGHGEGEALTPAAAAAAEHAAPLKVSDSLRTELRSNLQRFESQISHAHSQVGGGAWLCMYISVWVWSWGTHVLMYCFK